MQSRKSRGEVQLCVYIHLDTDALRRLKSVVTWLAGLNRAAGAEVLRARDTYIPSLNTHSHVNPKPKFEYIRYRNVTQIALGACTRTFRAPFFVGWLSMDRIRGWLVGAEYVSVTAVAHPRLVPRSVARAG